MSRLRNPFRLRASEKIESNASFLKLYNPAVLDSIMEKDKVGALWNNVLYIHSSPGAGKTSLLRVFEPETLNTLLNNKSAPDSKTLFGVLKKLNVLTDSSINLLGVTLLCTRNYEILEELDVSEAQKKRYFFSLLNSRIVLATLRSIVELLNTNTSFTEILERVSYKYDNRDNFFTDLIVPCTGRDLYKWASDIEKKVYQAIDSFLPLEEIKPQGHDELFSIAILKPEYFQFDGKPIFERVLFMLDDTHKLSSTQRTALKKYVIEKRGNFSIWISERLEALDPKDNLRSFAGRDYEELNLETFWGERPAKFEAVLSSIADKRAAISTEEVNSFREYLDNEFEEEHFKSELIQSINETKERIKKISSVTDKFNEWIKFVDDHGGSELDQAMLYKKLEILIHRNLGKPQLAFDFPLTEQEFKDKLKPDLEISSKLFLSQPANLPYYFGFGDLVKLSSNNIEQFLSFSADMFEEMLSNRLLGNKVNIETEIQEKIIRRLVEYKWNELSKILPYSSNTINFLTRLGESCRSDTYRPNAPYALGVTGFAIRSKPDMFSNGDEWYLEDIYSPLATAISTCVAFNLLEMKTINQGEKGTKNDVYYLNRWLCIKFDLPFSYGGWRHKSVDELLKWTKL
ncbi:MAG: hypothetical protein GXC73_14040 [Chitinophagaceae bacterium]|nr:hypothetical protein [Chitinophagaceae bacterium]